MMPGKGEGLGPRSTPRPRPSPFALGLPGGAWVDERFAAVADEAASRGSDPADPGAFLLLAQVGAALQDLRVEEDRAGPEAFHAFGLFLFHAFHLFRGDPAPGMLLDVEPAMARYLVEGEPAPGGWSGDLPASAGYLRMPRNLFWTRPGGEEAPAEALDGVAWCRSRGPGGSRQLALLAVTGVVGERAGFSVLPVPPAPMADAPGWLTNRARGPDEGADFETTLPGGELGNLYSVETAGELLKLASRALALAVTAPETLQAAASAEAAVEAAPDAAPEAASSDAAEPHALDRRLQGARLVLAPG